MKVFLLCCILSLALIPSVWAQEDVLRPHGSSGSSSSGKRTSSSSMPVSIGIDAGINYNMFSQNLDAFHYLANSPDQALKSGSGISPFFDVYLDLGIAKSVGLQFRLSYDKKDFSNKFDGELPSRIWVYDPNFQQYFPVDTIAQVREEYDINPAYVGIAALVRFDLTPAFFVTVGPILHLQTGSITQNTTLTVLSPDSVRFYVEDTNGDGAIDFRDQGKKEVTTSTDITNATSTRFGLEVGLGYKIPLSSSIDLIPKAAFQYFLSSASGVQKLPDGTTIDTKSTLHSLQLSIGLLFRL